MVEPKFRVGDKVVPNQAATRSSSPYRVVYTNPTGPADVPQNRRHFLDEVLYEVTTLVVEEVEVSPTLGPIYHCRVHNPRTKVYENFGISYLEGLLDPVT